VSNNKRKSRARARYVTWLEKADISLLWRRLNAEALEASKTEQAISRPCRTPFLAYHGECTLVGCPLSAHDQVRDSEREVAILNAQYAVWLAAQPGV
jgi:hypothetical protein